jgi:release factor glutamine methyltransferase
MQTVLESFKRLAPTKRFSKISDIYVVTDQDTYLELDQVFPMHAEQQFFLEELQREKVARAEVLEIGLGSGVLSIGAAKAGATRVTALEINPRAKNHAGFNIMVNGVEDRIVITDGDRQNIFKPVIGRQFDYIMSNPPFEPTPPGLDNFYHSDAGLYGMDFLENIFKGLDEHLSAHGHAQFVTAAPGDAQGPFMLVDSVKKYLPGQTTIIVNSVPITFAHMAKTFAVGSLASPDQVQNLLRIAEKDGVTHEYLCVIHYERGPTGVRVETSKRAYQDWEHPLPEFS